MKRYIKPEAQVISAKPIAILAGSPKEDHEIEDAYAKRNDIFDLVESENDNRSDWPSYSAWDE